MNEKELIVSKAYTNDIGKGIARLDPQTLDELHLFPGDVIEIIGRKRTVAKVWRLAGQDWGKGIIRIDEYIQKNADVSIEDRVTIRKIDAKNAEEVVLSNQISENTYFSSSEYLEVVKRQLLSKVVIAGDIVPIVVSSIGMISSGFMVGGKIISLIVVSTKPPNEAVLITKDTKLIFMDRLLSNEALIKERKITYKDIGGLDRHIQKVREMIELPIKHPEVFIKLGIEPPKGILLHGPPGTGKTLLAKAVATESGANFFSIAGPEIMNKYYGESEKQLRKIFEDARKNAPSIIFIDELDSIASKREEVTGEVEHRVVAQLLSLLDGLEERGNVVVIGATNRIGAIDPALRRPGRFDREIEIGVPDKNGRKEILKIHTRKMPLAKDINLDSIADQMYGFVGADIQAVVKEAAMITLRRYLPQMNLDEKEIPSEILDNIEITADDIKEALKEVEPSALREIIIEIPNIRWSDIGGLDIAKMEIKEAVELPLNNPEVFEHMGIKPIKNIFLYGPPGTGKTLLAKAVATESGANFICIKGPELLSKWVGESEKAIREVFKKARQVAPSVIFFDEIDAIAPVRGMVMDSRVSERVVNQLLTELDGMENMENVVVIAATNMPHLVDPSILRPGRFDRSIFIGVPDKAARKEIFKIHTKNMPLASDVDLDELAEYTENYVGSDIELICREAAILVIRETFANKENIRSKKVEKRHFLAILDKIKPSIDDSTMNYYLEIEKKFKSRISREDASLYVGYR
ncbi:MAG: AAA family ATPase [Candidatus Methanoliparum thermophilum]|uniref:AAA family ATPase n=1 Tax=Methanoliparum thermophilum TaxID=2491083 RepID=A0A520KSG7_METT2|nr:CDC48 family AAA ATPase [Candidatus Methanoliparum sp. LAM-1]RZN64869.1 MAG: AAA family ATPase [Candidatus Methanoliparum thermophilum]BDC36258.1 ATPase [Candidatus Methanoliparum sp. LAM-1]